MFASDVYRCTTDVTTVMLQRDVHLIFASDVQLMLQMYNKQMYIWCLQQMLQLLCYKQMYIWCSTDVTDVQHLTTFVPHFTRWQDVCIWCYRCITDVTDVCNIRCKHQMYKRCNITVLTSVTSVEHLLYICNIRCKHLVIW